MAIAWRKFESTSECYEQIIKKSGFKQRRGEKYSDTETNKFLVLCKFRGDKDSYEPRMAQLLNYSEFTASGKKPDSYNLSVDGMSGRIDISHWTEINLPKL